MKKEMSNKLIISIIILDFIFCSSLFIIYSVSLGFKDWLITTAMTTRTHQYLAKIFYADTDIKEVLNDNVVIENTVDSNPIEIEYMATKKVYQDAFDRQILEHEIDESYKVIDINGDNYKGFLVAIYDASKIKLGLSKYFGNRGQFITDIAKANNALIAINASGFEDPNWHGDGGEPTGSVVKDGRIVWQNARPGAGGVVGFNNKNQLILSKESIATASNKYNLRDAVEFGPFLIVNGVPSFIKGNGGWGTAPRTAIGQRQDGIVLMLVIDGRRPGYSIGASMLDLTTIMTNYKAYNAVNLDGGSSSALYISDKVINKPVAAGQNGLRYIPNIWYLEK